MGAAGPLVALGHPGASLTWVLLLSLAALFHTSGVPVTSGWWRVPLLVLAVVVAVGGLIWTGFAAARPTIGRAEHTRLLGLQDEHLRGEPVEPDVRSRREQRERPLNPTMAVLASSSVGAGELVHVAMVVPMIAMLWARAALDTTGWLPAAMVLVGLLLTLSAAFWIHRAHQVFRAAAPLDVPALVAR